MHMCVCVSLGDPPGYQQTGWLIHAERTRDLEDCFSTSGDRDWVAPRTAREICTVLI